MNSRSAWQERRARMEGQSGRSSVVGRKPFPVLHYLIRSGAAITRLTGLSKLAMSNSMDLTVSTLELRCPRLPAELDGFTVLHLSDLHFEAMPAFAASVAARLGEVEADVAVITGDYQIDEDKTDPQRAVELMHPLVAAIKARHGIYGVLGNHDSWRVVEPLERIGLHMLVNEYAQIGAGAEAIQLVGIDDIHAFYTDDAVRAIQDVPKGFRIVLSHTPEVADIAAATGCDLYLAGHTHGGQICLPNGRPLLTGLDKNRELASGHWRIGAMHGYTTRGLGVAALPLRLNCPPEIVVLRLRAIPG